MNAEHRDLRQSALYREAERLYNACRQPGRGQVSDASDLSAAPDGRSAVFSGVIVDRLEGTPPSRICRIDLQSGALQVLTAGPNADRLPKYSPDGSQVAFLSDRHRSGDFRLHLLDLASGAAKPAPPVQGWIEYLQWSPDGERILLGVAGHGADVAGGQGAIASRRSATGDPEWMPMVETGDESFRRRRLWVLELATGIARAVGPAALNVWEAVWCGRHTIVAVASSGPGEGLWYRARLHYMRLETGTTRELHSPQEQLGLLAAASCGDRLAFVEAVCSDRGIVAGDLCVMEPDTGRMQRLDTHGVDITHIEWRSDSELLLGGHRRFETVIGRYDLVTRSFRETWVSRDVSVTGRYASASGLGPDGDCVLLCESFVRGPEVAVIRGGKYRTVRSLDAGHAESARAIGTVDCLSWEAPDGLEIDGWLLRPNGDAPHPLIMNVHGGPVWQWRPLWLGRHAVGLLMCLQRGYAVFLPNPRGSTGRGQQFIRRVLGDLGGADAHDLVSGLDHLAAQGTIDSNCVGVTGQSYGGFMSAWLVTQTRRFAAAVPVAPVTNHVTEHLLSNIPHFVSTFLQDSYTNTAGKYYSRSPLLHAHNCKTPSLTICGALDRCTPPGEAIQFHNALLENGVPSVLVTYPQEGHGIRKFPAAMDYAARLVDWFETHAWAPSHALALSRRARLGCP